MRPRDDSQADAAIADDPISAFVTARWGFHERHRGKTIYCRNSHEPWPLQHAELIHLNDGLLAAAGFTGLADRAPDSVLYAAEITTVFAPPRVVTT